MAGIRTWGPRKRRMEGIDKSTELSWTPIFFKNCFLLTKNIPRWHLADATKVAKLIGIVGSIPNPKPLGSDTNMWPVNQTQPLPSQWLAIGALWKYYICVNTLRLSVTRFHSSGLFSKRVVNFTLGNWNFGFKILKCTFLHFKII